MSDMWESIGWSYIVPLQDLFAIESFEAEFGIVFPNEYVDFITKYNGGYPHGLFFDAHNGKTIRIKSFLSFNPDMKESIWRLNSISSPLVVIAIDDYGNPLCYRKQYLDLIFIDLNKQTLEKRADTLIDFFFSEEEMGR